MSYKFYGWDSKPVSPISDEYTGIGSQTDLYDALSHIWAADTCAPRMRDEWTKENPSFGQCSVTAFLAQDIFGGKVYGILRKGGNYHCYNVVGDSVFDLTSEQFGDEVLDYTDNPEQDRKVHFAKEEKHQRYELLKKRLQSRQKKEDIMTANIEVFTQNSIRIRTGAGIVYIDPFQMKEEPKDADFVLVTHDHYDHFSPEDIGKVSKADTVLVVPEKMAGKAREVSGMVGQIETVKPGMHREISGFEFETVPAYNTLKPFHPKGAEWVGYILQVDGQRVYIAGDTDATREARAVKCDVAIVPIGGTYTMDAKKAAELINEIQPGVAIPVHYGNIVGKVSDGETFAENVKPPVKVEFKIRF